MATYLQVIDLCPVNILVRILIHIHILFDSEYVPLVNLISILFQIRDDYMNLQSSGSYADNKGFAEDLTEGKFSFLVTHAVRKEMGNRELLSEYGLSR